MGRLTLFERIRVVKLFNELEMGCKNKFRLISFLAQSKYGIEISEKGAREIIKTWHQNQRFADKVRTNQSQLLNSNAGMLAINDALLKNPSLNLNKLKAY